MPDPSPSHVPDEILNRSLRSEHPPFLQTPLVATIAAIYLDRIGFVETIDSALAPDPDEWQMSPGNLARAIVLFPFIQYFHRRLPYYDLDSYYGWVDMDLLFTSTARPEWLTPDAFTSMLDSLHAAGPERLFTTLALRAYTAFSIPFDPAIYGETATFILWGAFEDADDEESGPARVMLSFACDPTGIPLAATTCYGSEADCIRDPTTLHTLAEQNPFIYIADSKIATARNLLGLQEAGLRFAARYPAGLDRKAATRTIQDAYESDAWLPVDMGREEPDTYEVQEFIRVVGDSKAEFRVLVFRSSNLREKFESRISASREEVLSILADITAREFTHESDALRAIKGARWRLRTHRLWTVDLTAGAGGSGWVIRAGDPELNRDLYRTELQKAETIVLITNTPAEELPAQEILRLATEPKTKKDSFTILEDPIAVDPAFLENPGRVDAFVALLAYTHLIQRLIRRLVHRNLDAMPEPPRLDASSRSLARPGLMRILQTLFAYKLITHQGRRRFQEISQTSRTNLPIWLKLLEIDPGTAPGPAHHLR